jgi:hypothetical protein
MGTSNHLKEHRILLQEEIYEKAGCVSRGNRFTGGNSSLLIIGEVLN